MENDKEMEKSLEELNSAFEDFMKDAHKRMEKGNKAAGVRSRKKSIEIQQLFKNWRKVSV